MCIRDRCIASGEAARNYDGSFQDDFSVDDGVDDPEKLDELIPVSYTHLAFKEASVVQLEQIRTIDKSRIDNYLGKVTPREICLLYTSRCV